MNNVVPLAMIAMLKLFRLYTLPFKTRLETPILNSIIKFKCKKIKIWISSTRENFQLRPNIMFMIMSTRNMFDFYL